MNSLIKWEEKLERSQKIFKNGTGNQDKNRRNTCLKMEINKNMQKEINGKGKQEDNENKTGK